MYDNSHDEHLPFFVYGTLRPGCGNDRLWDGMADAVGTATAPGFDLVNYGPFPYAVAGTSGTITGTVIEAHDGLFHHVLERMDGLEGVRNGPNSQDGHYVRIKVAIVHDGVPRHAWMYVASEDDRVRLADHPLIPSGDWHDRIPAQWRYRR